MWPFQKPKHDAREWVAQGALLLDVRTPDEFRGSHLPGAKNIPVHELPARLDEVSRGAKVVVYCRSGARSAAAAQMLSRHGCQVLDIGGMGNW